MTREAIVNTVMQLLEHHQWLSYFINIMLKSAAVFTVVLIITLCFRKYSAAARHLIWCVALISFILLPLIILVVPTMDVAVLALVTESGLGNQSVELREFVQTLSADLSSWGRPLLLLYSVVAFSLVAYTALGIIRVRMLTTTAQIITSETSLSELNNILGEEGIFANIEILESEALRSPLSWGLFKPVIILPVQARSWSRKRIRNVLIHEVCHIQRLDWLSHMFARLATAMYWCNPLVWYAARKMAEEAEQACDDAVVLYGKSQSDYANDLLEIARDGKPQRQRHILAEAIAHSFLGSRVLAILDSGRVRNKTESVWVIRALLVTLTLVGIVSSLKLVPETNIAVVNDRVVERINVIYIPVEYGVGGTEELLAVAEKPMLENVVLLPSFERAINEIEQVNNFQTEVSNMNADVAVPQAELMTIVLDENDVNLPLPINTTLPVYPAQASRRGIEGYSVVEFEISVEGKVMNPMVIESSPGSTFNQASIKAVQNYLYEPPVLNGEAVTINGLRTRFVYQLDPGPG